MASRSKQKGSAGEREVAKLLSQVTNRAVSRNLEQTRSGGADLLDVPGLVIEVKRREVLTVNVWWKQVTDAARASGGIPVLAYRQNRKAWNFCLPMRLVDYRLTSGFFQLQEAEFIEWLELYMEAKTD